MNNKSKIKHLQPALIEIRCSKMLKEEIGLFAVRHLKKGTIIGHIERFDENFYSWSDYAKLDIQTKNQVDKFCASTRDGFWAPDDMNYIHRAYHMNHCCNGNVAFDAEDNFITIRNVHADEELCFDYGLIFTNPIFRLECKCGSENCRGVITGNDWKNAVFRRKNIYIMSKDMRELCLQRLDDK